ncbi:MAG TPA: hypothetical protein VJ828_04040 [Lacipirellulaceae bacterium]|nr:hypothetical protein [Lacipirellulaceae bacterium]
MNRFTCFIVPALLLTLAPSASAQRVQFPTPAQPVQMQTPYTPPGSTYSAPPPTYGSTITPPASGTPLPPAMPSYPTTPYTPPPYATTPVPPGTPYSPSGVGPPPLFDPYASGSTSGPPPPAVPYNYTPPPPASAFPQQPGSLFPDGLPYQWQPAPIASSGETYWQKTQRFLQELSFEHTYLYGDHSDPFDLEINRTELSSTFAIPMFYNIETPLLITPGFAANWLEGPLSGPPMGMVSGGPDLPPRLYDAYLDLAWYPRITESIGAELGARTGVWSDFQDVNSDSIRLLGRGLASVALTPNLDVLFGAVYLDRIDVKLLPAGGFYYRPTPEWDMYLVFPNPKVRRFMTAIGNSKWYWYAAGEYGGGSWTVERQVRSDRIDYNDIRVSGGLEFETQSFIRGHIEVGYVFDREVIFASGDPPTFKPDHTFMVRGGIDF